MSYSNYPECMSREDWIRVGEIEDPDAMPEWFPELLAFDDPDLAEDLWDKCRRAGEYADEYYIDNYAYSKRWAFNWLRNHHPEAAAPVEYTNSRGELKRWSGYYEDWLSAEHPMIRDANRKYVPANPKLVWSTAF